MQHLEEGTIHAWLDGELPANEVEKIAVHVSECPECEALVTEARGLIAASTRILTALDNVPAGVMPGGSAASDRRMAVGGPARHRRWYERMDFRAAAALLLVAGGSLVAVKLGRNPGVSVQTAARVNRPVSAAEPLQDKGVSSVAQTTKQDRALEVDALVGGKTGTVERMRSKNTVAASKSAEARPSTKEAIVSGGATATIAPAPGMSQLSEVVVSGVASTAGIAATPLRVLSVDSTATGRRVVYQVSPGVEVILVESPIDVASERDLMANRSAKQEKTPDSTIAENLPGLTLEGAAKADRKAAPMAISAAQRRPINRISWRDLNRRYTLSGPLTPSELETIKAQLTKMRR